MNEHRKILVVGDAGRGKTTFASSLAKKIGIPHFSTDDFYFEKKFSIPREKSLAIEKIQSEVYSSLDSWVVDGTTKHLIKGGLEKSDTIYLLVFDNIIHQYLSIIHRSFKRRRGDGPRESLSETFGMLKHVTKKRYDTSYSSHMSHLHKLLDPYKNKIIKVNSFKKLNDILSSI